MSVRLPPDVLAKVDVWAARRGIKRNAAMVEMLRAAKPPVELPKAELIGHVEYVPVYEVVPVEKVISSFSLPVGPQPFKPNLKKR